MIIFVDDEPEKITGYLQAFELSGFDVNSLSSIDDAYAILEDMPEKVDAIILDVMMPSGIGLDLEETKNGLETGIRFLEWLKKYHERIPVIVLTNTVNASKKFNITHRNCKIYEKKEIGPWGLLEKMGEMKHRLRW